jgi:hypothetical protein
MQARLVVHARRTEIRGMTMDTETKQHMSTEEISLMREIVRWRKNHGIDFVRRINPYGDPYWKDYATGREVWFYRNESGMALSGLGDFSTADIPATSFTQAVDLLVAYGYLPQRFSSAYRAGWHASRVWEVGSDEFGTSDEFKRLFHDPLNVSFPVGSGA